MTVSLSEVRMPLSSRYPPVSQVSGVQGNVLENNVPVDIGQDQVVTGIGGMEAASPWMIS